jgi:hypothetical protein
LARFLLILVRFFVPSHWECLTRSGRGPKIKVRADVQNRCDCKKP